MYYLKNGTTLHNGEYMIVSHISSGGFGNTYKAINTVMQSTVAIKEFFIKDYCERDEQTSHMSVPTSSNRSLVEKLRGKFYAEAKAVYDMHHENIVRVTDLFEDYGTVYYVMDYIDGQSLHEMTYGGNPLPEDKAVDYIKQIANALCYVHSRQRLHLDIKPGNIMVNRKGKAILIDFGVSKVYDKANGENTSTMVGRSIGYSPIEQMSGDLTLFTPATDIYALGATLYKLVTGNTPIDAAALLTKGLPTLPKTVSPQIANAIAVAMQPQKDKRPQSVAAWLTVLDNSNATIVEVKTDKEDKSGWGKFFVAIFVAMAIVFAGAGIKWYIDNNHSKSSPSVSRHHYDNHNDEEDDDVEDDTIAIKEIVVTENEFLPIHKGNDHHKVNIQWPVALVGVSDISNLQQILINRAFGIDIDDIEYAANYRIAEMQKENYADVEWEYGEPESTLDIDFFQRLNGLYIFRIHDYSYHGSGTGASIFDSKAYVYYDIENDSEISLNDIIVNRSIVLNAINEHITTDDEGGEFMEKATDIPDEFVVSGTGIKFIFPKYSIGYGYQGEPEIEVTYEEMKYGLSTDFLRTIGKY